MATPSAPTSICKYDSRESRQYLSLSRMESRRKPADLIGGEQRTGIPNRLIKGDSRHVDTGLRKK